MGGRGARAGGKGGGGGTKSPSDVLRDRLSRATTLQEVKEIDREYNRNAQTSGVPGADQVRLVQARMEQLKPGSVSEKAAREARRGERRAAFAGAAGIGTKARTNLQRVKK